MPQLEMRGNGFDGIWILAVMNFPSDPEAREAFYAIKVAEFELERQPDQMMVGADLVRRLVAGPSKRELLELVSDSTKRGVVAGDFLATMYYMHLFPDLVGEPSVRKAIYVAQRFALRTTFGDGSRLPRSETAIRKAVEDYRSVAHLWAAFRLHGAYPKRDHRAILATPDAVEDFISIARNIEHFGCTYVSAQDRTRTTQLDPKTVWRVPKGTRVLTPPRRSPPQWIVETLKSYRAEP